MDYETLVKALKKRRGQGRGILSRGGKGGMGYIRNDTRLWWEHELDVCDSALALLDNRAVAQAAAARETPGGADALAARGEDSNEEKT